MDMFTQLAVSGVMVGAVYGLIALGFVLIYKSSGVINFAQGELVMMGAYFCYTGLNIMNLPSWLAFIFAFILASILAVVVNRVCIRPLVGQPLLAIIMMTIVLSIGLQAIAILGWKAGQFKLAIFGKDIFFLGNAVIAETSLWAFGLSILGMLVFWTYFRRTKGGLAMRAVAENHQASRSVGVSISTVFSSAWIIASIVGALGGILLATTSGVTLDLSHVGLKVLPVVLLGGLDSIPGALIGGVVIGVSEYMAVGYVDDIMIDLGFQGVGVRDVFPYILAIVILIVRPYGLFGQKRIERI
ncbi:MAG: branched-chain amino acid ABC transporter permease [Chloroflexota bacterium]|nr:branched-chain amino acid ABC transporter permease [Chloroflexota bacterium]